MSDIDSELKALREQLAERRAASEQAHKQRELEALKRQLSEDEIITALEQQHGVENIRVVDTAKGVVVVGKPAETEYKRFSDTLDKLNHTAAARYAALCILHPPKDEYTKLVAAHPALVWPLVNAINSLAAAAARVREGESIGV